MIRRSAALALFAIVSCSAGNAASAGDAPALPPATSAPAADMPQSPASGPVDGARAYAHMKTMVEFGPRPAGSDANVRTREYIAEQARALGLDVREQTFTADTPIGPVKMANVIVTLPGTRPERVIIGSHFDTKPETAYEFVGANDGGSSTGLLVELARVLKDRPREFTYELVFFDGEESWGEWSTGNTFGSRHYVRAARDAGTLTGIKAMILLDMVGEKNVRLLKDTMSTTWLSDLIWDTAASLGHRSTFVNGYTAVDDDHIPFINAGIPAVDLIDLDYPAWHTPNDTLDKTDATSLEIVGNVVVAALPKIEARLAQQ